tara:strand:+ start:412 stop:1020 length:609 start_codon:yes stop_codon:yes gene_type:complete
MRHRSKIKKNNNEDESDNEDDLSDITVIRNHIYFYSNVDTKPIKQLNQAINSLNEPGKCYPEIWIHINSYGGGIYDALAAVDTIHASPTPIVTIVEGIAASAATLISIAGDRRLIRPNAAMLIHQMRCGFYGKNQDAKDEMNNINKMEAKLTALYLDNTKLTKTKLKKILCRENEYDAKDCMKMGLVDEIFTAPVRLGKRKR